MKYVTPDFEIVFIHQEDVITTSGGLTNGGSGDSAGISFNDLINGN